jgi:hypothetical protein
MMTFPHLLPPSWYLMANRDDNLMSLAEASAETGKAARRRVPGGFPPHRVRRHQIGGSARLHNVCIHTPLVCGINRNVAT